MSDQPATESLLGGASEFPAGNVWSDEDGRPIYLLYTARETADALGVTERTVRRWIKGGGLEAEKVGGAFRIDIREARAFQQTTRTARRADGDPEMRAIRAISDHLEPLEQPVRDRIFRWAVDKFDAAIQ